MTEKKPTDELSVHIDSGEVREGILNYQVHECPTCKGPVTDGFGLAGGGFGAYGYCEKCKRIVWKCTVEE